MNKIKRAAAIIIIVVIVLAIFIPAVSTPAFADTSKWDKSAYYVNLYPNVEGSNAVRCGGTNTLDDVRAESREETEELEQYLKKHDYVLANSENKEISDEELGILKALNINYKVYLDEENYRFNDESYKLYVYKSSLNSAVKEYNKSGVTNNVNQYELNMSTVLIDYFTWYTVERVGQIMGNEEINENLPERYEKDAGFVEFTSPINAEVILHLIDNNYFYKIYLSRGKTLVKLRSEHYEITNINSVDVYWGEELVTNNNYLIVRRNPEYDPIVVNFVPLVARDHIPDKDISGMPNCAWIWEEVDIDDLGDIIVEEGKDKDDKKSFPWGWIVMILTLGGMGAGFYVFIKKSR